MEGRGLIAKRCLVSNTLFIIYNIHLRLGFELWGANFKSGVYWGVYVEHAYTFFSIFENIAHLKCSKTWSKTVYGLRGQYKMYTFYWILTVCKNCWNWEKMWKTKKKKNVKLMIFLCFFTFSFSLRGNNCTIVCITVGVNAAVNPLSMSQCWDYMLAQT